MSYDLVVLDPAALGQPVSDAAVDHAYAELVTAAGTPSPPVADFVASLHQIAGGHPTGVGRLCLSTPPAAGADGVIVATSPDMVDTNRHEVIRLAVPHGLVVFDPQRGDVLDTRGGVGVTLETEHGVTLPFVTAPALRAAIAQLGPDGRWVVLTRRPQVYAQTYRQEDDRFRIEHRAGDPSSHVGMITPDAVLVHRVLWGWAIQAPGWDAGIGWADVGS